MLELKVPPPIVALVLALLMWLTPAVAGLVQIPYPARVLCAVVLVCIGQGVGIALKVDERRQTSMPGIYAAGDLATPFLPSVTLASSQGAMAGIFAQQSMVV